MLFTFKCSSHLVDLHWSCFWVSVLSHPAFRAARHPVRFWQRPCQDPDLFRLHLFGPRFVCGCGILLVCLSLWTYQKIALLCLRIYFSTYPPWKITSLRIHPSKKSILDVCKDAKIVHPSKYPPWPLCRGGSGSLLAQCREANLEPAQDLPRRRGREALRLT